MSINPVRFYINSHKNKLPDYWYNHFSYETIEAACNMIARSCYSKAEIAEFFGCPVELISRIQTHYKNRIATQRKEYAKAQSVLHKVTAMQPSGESDIFDFQNILDSIISAHVGGAKQ